MILRYIVRGNRIEVVTEHTARPHRILAVTAGGNIITRRSRDGQVITMMTGAEVRFLARAIRRARWRRLFGARRDDVSIRSQIARAFGASPSDEP